MRWFDLDKGSWLAHTIAMVAALMIFGAVGFGVVWLFLQFMRVFPTVNPG